MADLRLLLSAYEVLGGVLDSLRVHTTPAAQRLAEADYPAASAALSALVYGTATGVGTLVDVREALGRVLFGEVRLDV